MAIGDEEDPALVGSPYARVRLLGRGGMGTVLLARHRTLGTKVVVKLMHESYAKDAEALERLRVEAQTQAKLRSPHLLVCHDFGVTAAGAPYFATDYVEGVTLQDELGRRGALPLPEALEITRQILEGLAVAHRAGIVHRDIKPSNLLLTREGGALLVKILDFGVAKILPKESATSLDAPSPSAFPTAEGLIVGTPRYCSPEQALAKPVDARADLFSVGLVLAQMVTARAPHADKLDMAQLLLAQVLEPFDPPSRWNPGVPPELDELVLRAVEKEPAHRFEGARQMAECVERVLALVRRPASAPLPATRPPAVVAAERLVAAPTTPAVSQDQTERMPQPVPSAPRATALEQSALAPSGLPPEIDLSRPPDPTVRVAPALPSHLAIPRPPLWFVITVTALIVLVISLSIVILTGP